jgi:hypothetical protein
MEQRLWSGHEWSSEGARRSGRLTGPGGPSLSAGSGNGAGHCSLAREPAVRCQRPGSSFTARRTRLFVNVSGVPEEALRGSPSRACAQPPEHSDRSAFGTPRTLPDQSSSFVSASSPLAATRAVRWPAPLDGVPRRLYRVLSNARSRHRARFLAYHGTLAERRAWLLKRDPSLHTTRTLRAVAAITGSLSIKNGRPNVLKPGSVSD